MDGEVHRCGETDTWINDWKDEIITMILRAKIRGKKFYIIKKLFHCTMGESSKLQKAQRVRL
jgi:hypothetical protein